MLTSALATGKKLAKWALKAVSVVSGVSPPTNNLLPSSSAEVILFTCLLLSLILSSTTSGSGIWTEYSGIKQSYYGSILLLL